MQLISQASASSPSSLQLVLGLSGQSEQLTVKFDQNLPLGQLVACAAITATLMTTKNLFILVPNFAL